MGVEFLTANQGRYGMVYRCAKCEKNVKMHDGFKWTLVRGLRVRICKPCAALPKVTK